MRKHIEIIASNAPTTGPLSTTGTQPNNSAISAGVDYNKYINKMGAILRKKSDVQPWKNRWKK